MYRYVHAGVQYVCVTVCVCDKPRPRSHSIRQSLCDFLIACHLHCVFHTSPSPPSHDHIEIMSSQGELLFFRQRDGPYIPTLRLLHKCGYSLGHSYRGLHSGCPHVNIGHLGLSTQAPHHNRMCLQCSSPGQMHSSTSCWGVLAES